MYVYVQIFLHLGNERYAALQEYKGKTLVHVRQYVKYGERYYPTPLGVHLSVSHLGNLIEVLDEINRDVQDFKDKKIERFQYIIGDGVHISANKDYPVIDIRYFFQTPIMPFAHPTRKGLALRFNEWETFINFIDMVKKEIDLIKSK